MIKNYTGPELDHVTGKITLKDYPGLTQIRSRNGHRA